MTVRRASLGFVLTVTFFVAVSAVYLLTLSPSETWLLFWKSEAETYARMALAGSVPKEGPLYEDFIDVYSEANPNTKTVLFSPHDNHEIAVIFAPGRLTEDLKYNDKLTARRIQRDWYAF
jgi:hypothetical protein